ncbi:50S ribosomal protein L15 [Pleodorina starrii]|uniref:50S ribosomal protein L15 n=1 Tax=Pleodorina starrii TaxID=330485 RepID=A0A9W6BM79_9CHLO|nr:50S ribosomal protein L15 [Pleodorina starrii]GLC54127.1 50S ribosomal protein L15 [Pleodorina starrii]GLC64569.1 50S ribosomal protein L15 [Pleodorina starrii]
MQVASRALRSSVRPFTPASVRAPRALVVSVSASERLRLHNLSPEPGSRRDEKRKGRGHAAGQGGTCGFGNRGQKSRSGPSVRPGFEGGQTPLYRRLPKLRGIAGGMSAGVPDFVVVNLDDLEKHFAAGEEVTLDAVKEKVLSVSGRDTRLPLKVLGSGSLTKSLTVHATAFSESAKAAIEAAGGKAEVVAAKAKWTRKAYKKLVAELAEKGQSYEKEQLKKRIDNLKSKGMYVERTPKVKAPVAAKKK